MSERRRDVHSGPEQRRMGRNVTKDLAKAFVPGDLAKAIELVLDLAYYRTEPAARELGAAAWVELFDRIAKLPEAATVAQQGIGLPAPRRRRRWFR